MHFLESITEGIAGIKTGYVICGIIWAIALGFAAGNYACSLVHRLPRGRLILDKKPYCGSCGKLLAVRDLFPVVSALLLRHRCRYCGTPFPVSHTWTELLVGLLFVLAFLQYNFSEPFVLIVGLGVFLITLAAIQANEDMVMGKVLLTAAVFGMLLRTLEDGGIYNFFQGGLLALIVGALLWHRRIQRVGHVYIPPKPVELLVAGGICVGDRLLLSFFILYAGFYVLDWLLRKILRSSKPPVMTVSFGFAVMLTVLYPKAAALLPHMILAALPGHT